MNFSHQPGDVSAGCEAACDDADIPPKSRITLSRFAFNLPQVSYAIRSSGSCLPERSVNGVLLTHRCVGPAADDMRRYPRRASIASSGRRQPAGLGVVGEVRQRSTFVVFPAIKPPTLKGDRPPWQGSPQWPWPALPVSTALCARPRPGLGAGDE